MMSKLTITVPTGAVCSLHAGIPSSQNFNEIDQNSGIAATDVITGSGTATHCYSVLENGVYHCAVSLKGHNSVGRIVNLTEDKELTIQPTALAGDGFEAGYEMLCSEEFEKNALVSHKDAWGARYANIFCTPQFKAGRRGKHQQTTNQEVTEFIESLRANSKNMYVFSLGTSPKYGYNMPLVLLTKENVDGLSLEQAAAVIRKNGKPTIQYLAQCHATEPASCEGALAVMASLCGEHASVLDAMDIYIIPRMNLDGAYEVTRKSPTTNEDMNRDYLYMHNAEVRMVTAAYNLFRPEVCIDGHEKMQRALLEEENVCTDVELETGGGALNHPAAMTQLVMTMALDALGKVRELGLRGHFYSRLASAAGGSAGSSYFGTRNSLSFLIETPGQVAVGMNYMERRVLAHYVIVFAIIDYTLQHSDKILSTVRNSREYMRQNNPVYDENTKFVLEHKSTVTGALELPLLRTATGEIIDQNHTVEYSEHTDAELTRSRATAFVIPVGLAEEQEILRVAKNHDLAHYTIPAGSTVLLRQYRQNEKDITVADEQTVRFENGAHVFPNTVDSTILSVIMEPDFNPQRAERKMTLLRMGLITADENGFLPLYRYCHTLRDGLVTVEL